MKANVSNYLLFAGLLMHLVACQAAVQQSQPNESDRSLRAFRGHLVLGHEVRSFKPCDSDQESWVLDRTGGDLWDVYRKLTNQPYQPMYVEVRGLTGPPPRDGFGAEYDNQLTIMELRRAGVETRGCEEDLGGFDFRASGNEPFWNVVISKAAMVFSELGNTQLTFPYAEPRVFATSWGYSSKTDGTSIEITIDEIRCVDYMSGEHFSFAAKVVLNGRTYTGCGREGWRDSHGDAANQELTIDELKSGEYRSEWSAKGKIKLSDGIYQEKIVPESATELVIKLSDKMAYGDLNGDGAEDAAVILISDPGGSGTFYDLAAVINSNGNPQHAASAFLGDRVKVEEVDISSGKIVVKMVIHKRNDPMCCPSLKVEQKYGLQGDELVRQPLEMKASGRR
ncbi:MAG: COG3650 family protein [Syntrophobacteria bacterium]